MLRDPKDDMVLEVAAAGRCGTILGYDKREFDEASKFGIQVVTARAFLGRIGELKRAR